MNSGIAARSFYLKMDFLDDFLQSAMALERDGATNEIQLLFLSMQLLGISIPSNRRKVLLGVASQFALACCMA
jgi:hypothetical protein